MRETRRDAGSRNAGRGERRAGGMTPLRWFALAGAVALLLASLIISVRRSGSITGRERPLAERVQDAEVALYIVSLGLEEQRERHGAYPPEPGPLPDCEAITYRRTGGGYELTCSVGDTVLTRSSADETEPPLGAGLAESLGLVVTGEEGQP